MKPHRHYIDTARSQSDGKWAPTAWLALCIFLSACQPTNEDTPTTLLPVGVTTSRALTQSEDGEEVTFKPGDTFLIVAHTGDEKAPLLWYSGLYRFPTATETQTLRPVTAVNFENNTCTEGNNRGGLYLPNSAAGISYNLHLVWPAAKDQNSGFISVPRQKSIFFGTPEQSITIKTANPNFTTNFPQEEGEAMQLTQMISALSVSIRQNDAAATAQVTDVRLLNAGDSEAQVHLHTRSALLTYSVNPDILIGTGTGTEGNFSEAGREEGGWRTENRQPTTGDILYQTYTPIRIHCANYQTATQALSLAMSVTYIIAGREEPIQADITLPLTFLNAAPSKQYNLTLNTNPKAVYVTYTVTPYNKDKVEQEGTLGTPVYTGGIFTLSTGQWIDGGHFNNEM